MKIFIAAALLFLVAAATAAAAAGPYKPSWDSLDSRPLPDWYLNDKIGIFIHWGVFSVPAFASEWFWSDWKISNRSDVVAYMRDNYPPNFSYQEFAPQFTAKFWDPAAWADLFAASGARYVVLTSKHHEGYTLWPSETSWGWNSMDVGPKRDLVGELAGAIRSRTNLTFGLYHSLFEWFHPMWLADKEAKWATNLFVHAKTGPELYDLVERYRPEILWSDGDWDAPAEYWNSTEFIAWLYNESPVRETVVTNDRWGHGVMCNHGGFLTCADRFQPGHLLDRKWENAFTLDKRSWGFRRNAPLADYMTLSELVATVAETVAYGGNVLINVGPTHEGIIDPLMEERLRQLGAWLAINGEAIYDTVPWRRQNDTLAPAVWYTKSDVFCGSVYAILTEWPAGGVLHLGAPLALVEDRSRVFLMGDKAGAPPLKWAAAANVTTIQLPRVAPGSDLAAQPAWVVKILKH